MVARATRQRAGHGNRLGCRNGTTHLKPARVTYFAADDEVRLLEIPQHQCDFRSIEPFARFCEDRSLGLLYGESLQFDVANDVHCCETIRLDGNGLIEFRCISVVNFQHVGRLNTIARITLGETYGLRKGSARTNY